LETWSRLWELERYPQCSKGGGLPNFLPPLEKNQKKIKNILLAVSEGIPSSITAQNEKGMW